MNWSSARDEAVIGDIVVVSGLPRSGTSMMMRMLEAGGVNLLTDSERGADDDNPRGYYEYAPVKRLARDASWVRDARGKAIKVVSRLLYELPTDFNYDVVFMQREIGEVLASQQVMLTRMGTRVAESEQEQLRLRFQSHLVELEEWLARQRCFRVLCTEFARVHAAAEEEAVRVRDFLGQDLDTNAMARAVDEALYRQRAN